MANGRGRSICRGRMNQARIGLAPNAAKAGPAAAISGTPGDSLPHDGERVLPVLCERSLPPPVQLDPVHQRESVLLELFEGQVRAQRASGDAGARSPATGVASSGVPPVVA
jgi:hypothetical protein